MTNRLKTYTNDLYTFIIEFDWSDSRRVGIFITSSKFW